MKQHVLDAFKSHGDGLSTIVLIGAGIIGEAHCLSEELAQAVREDRELSENSVVVAIRTKELSAQERDEGAPIQRKRQPRRQDKRDKIIRDALCEEIERQISSAVSTNQAQH